MGCINGCMVKSNLVISLVPYLINRRQLHIFSIKPKLDMRLFVDFCVFLCFSLNLPELNLKLFKTISGLAQVNSGENGVKRRNQQTILYQVLV